MEKALWAKRIADRMHASENKIDEASRAMMELVSEILAGQADLNVSAVSTDQSLSKLMEAVNLLQQARTSAVHGHRRLECLGTAMGVRTTAIGLSPGKTMVDDQELVAGEQRQAV